MSCVTGSDMIHDYSNYSDGPTVDQLGKITDAVDAYLDAQVDAAKAEAEYKEALRLDAGNDEIRANYESFKEVHRARLDKAARASDEEAQDGS